MDKYGYGGPERFRPLSPWAYFGYTILFSIPVVGLICLIVFSLSDTNINRRNFARSYFCALVLLLIVVSSVLGLLPSVLTGKIIDDGLIGRNMKLLITLILVSLGVTLGSNLIKVGESYLNNWIAQHISYDMRNKMYRHLQKMSQRFFTSSNQGDIITRMTSDISGVERVVTNTFTSILSNTITLVAAIIIMFR